MESEQTRAEQLPVCTSLLSPSLCPPIYYVCTYVCTYVELTWTLIFCCTESQVLHGQVESDVGPGEHRSCKFAWNVDGSWTVGSTAEVA